MINFKFVTATMVPFMNTEETSTVFITSLYNTSKDNVHNNT